jgi:YebC/PmpR family DNA-binding regulatory protein
VVIEALTDNRNRTIASIRHTFGKHNGNLGATNSVQYMFERKGTLTVPKEGLDEDALTEYVLEGGGEDLEDQEDSFLVICPLEAFESLRSLLEEKGVTIGSAELQRLPQARVTLSSKEDAEKVLTFLEALEEDDDVQKVFSNLDIDEAILAELT